MLEMRDYNYKEDGSFEEFVKKMTFDENEELMSDLNLNARTNLTLKEKFEENFKILKKYELISDDVYLEDIVDINKFEEFKNDF